MAVPMAAYAQASPQVAEDAASQNQGTGLGDITHLHGAYRKGLCDSGLNAEGRRDLTALALRTPVAELTQRQKSLAYLTLMVALVLEIVDVTIVNTALPVIERDFGAAAAQAQWVAAGYSLAFALLLMLGGRLGDAFGYNRLFIGGVAGFTFASLLCGLSGTPDQLIAARVLQGGAGAMMAPQVMALIQVLFEPLERVAKLAWVGVIGGLSAICGPIIGGVLIHANPFDLGWRSVFLINVPVGVAAVVVAWRLLPATRSPSARGIDGGGTLLFAASMAALLYPLVRGHDLGWQSWHIALLLAAPVLLALAWRRTCQRAEAGAPALFSPELFRQRQFPLGLAIALAFGAATGGFLFVFAFGAQKLLGFSPLETGLLHIPFSAGVMLGIAFLGRKLVTSHGKGARRRDRVDGALRRGDAGLDRERRFVLVGAALPGAGGNEHGHDQRALDPSDTGARGSQPRGRGERADQDGAGTGHGAGHRGGRHGLLRRCRDRRCGCRVPGHRGDRGTDADLSRACLAAARATLSRAGCLTVMMVLFRA